MNFIKTNMLLEINYEHGGTTYYTFKTPKNIRANYFHIIERKDYFIQGLYSGDIIKYYKNENKVEYINTVTNEIKILTSRTYKIYKEEL